VVGVYSDGLVTVDIHHYGASLDQYNTSVSYFLEHQWFIPRYMRLVDGNVTAVHSVEILSRAQI
jgi:hypothetical protein